MMEEKTFEEQEKIKELVLKKSTEYQLMKLDSMKRQLPRYIKKRRKQFAVELSEYMDKNSFDGNYMQEPDKIPLFDLIENVFKPIIKVAGAYSPAYTADELALAFDFYVECVKKLNEISAYTPKIEDFCRMINISKSAFNRYQRNSSDENMRELCEKIQDYCVAKIADGALTGRLEKVYSIFHQKSSNNQRDNEPVQNNFLIQNNTIMSDEQFKELANKVNNQS